ncbi:hypothetical protein L1857_13710 [Amycolatopsis thermalba]|uniref:MFS transporter n=1 Tax=Amycolatopsis thermalba TaxID=944492 RepID=A0ABY4NUR0_9PSEU|nr:MULTISPECIES: hypothetical protein [Amycolatopsis]UQS23809.1 hypothetical protein L1857_13710 [Amycolatopsis thermalba]
MNTVTAAGGGTALNQTASNAANSIGAGLGGRAIAAGHGYLSAAWVGAGLGAVGLVLAAPAFRLD